MLRSSKSTTLAITAASMAALASCTAAHGELIEFTFSGTITEIGFGAPSGYWGDIEVGMPWELSYVFDSRQPDEVPLDEQRGYWQMVSSSLVIGGGQAASPGVIQLSLDFAGADVYAVAQTSLPDESQAGVSLSGANVFDDDSLPTELDLGAFWSADFVLGVPGAPGGVFNATGPVEDLQIMVIPAPASMALVAFGLGRCVAPSRRARKGRSDKRAE